MTVPSVTDDGHGAPRHTRASFEETASALLRVGSATGLVVGVLAAVVSLWRLDAFTAAGIGSAAAGIGCVVVLFAAGVLGITRVLRGPAVLSLVGALAVFFVLTGLMLVLAVSLSKIEGLVTSAFAVAAVATVVGWQVGAARAFQRRRELRYAEPGEGSA